MFSCFCIYSSISVFNFPAKSNPYDSLKGHICTNKPENPFQNYDVARKTLKINQNFCHSLRKKKFFNEKETL